MGLCSRLKDYKISAQQKTLTVVRHAISTIFTKKVSTNIKIDQNT